MLLLLALAPEASAALGTPVTIRRDADQETAQARWHHLERVIASS